MHDPETFFVVPTHRLRDVSETIHEFDEHFWRNGHSPKMIVFDDSTPSNVDKYFSQLEGLKTRSELFYVGPRQKEEFITYVNSRLRNSRLEPLVKNLFRPSYGGNRNYTLMYSLGGLMVSSDDDMRPYSMMEDSPESLENDEISRGRLHKVGKNGYVRKSFDILSAFSMCWESRCLKFPRTTSVGNCWWTVGWTLRRMCQRACQKRTRWCCSEGRWQRMRS